MCEREYENKRKRKSPQTWEMAIFSNHKVRVAERNSTREAFSTDR